MPRVDLTLDVPVARTTRVAQVEGLFDVPPSERQAFSLGLDVPDLDSAEWRVGLVVGPSGSGKSTLARTLWPEQLARVPSWPADGAVVDGFPEDMPVKRVCELLSSVGFSSPPDWLKPYRVLSTGQKFRCDLARVLADPQPLSVVDEFTSVVDRTVAKVGSHAVARAVRKTPGRRLVAVTCHDDVEDWLQPDWVCEPGAGVFRWREQRRRPTLPLRLVRCDRSAWAWFHRHHYLTSDLHRAARCFLALVDGRAAGFCAVLPFPHASTRRLARVSRTVVLPDFQGLGLGSGLSELVARVCWENGKVALARTAHPALIAARARSKNWDMRSAPAFQRTLGKGSTVKDIVPAASRVRRAATFRWVGGGFEDPDTARIAKEMW